MLDEEKIKRTKGKRGELERTWEDYIQLYILQKDHNHVFYKDEPPQFIHLLPNVEVNSCMVTYIWLH